jgi:hypothetical protein
MSVSSEIENLKNLPKTASPEFRDQLERVHRFRAHIGRPGHSLGINARGIDRSEELRPLPRPTIIRTLAE